MSNLRLSIQVLATVLACGSGSTAVGQELQHFSPKGKPPSKYTVELQKVERNTLPFSDKQDFEEAKRGFIAAPSYRKIMNDKGDVAWNIDNWSFLLNGKEYDSIHPSLQRQATLNMEYGLFEVVPGIYQVRGFDLANISFIKGNTGWIVIDPLTVRETSRAALKFINEKLSERPVVAVIVSHSHADHSGGIRGVVDDAALAAGEVQIIAPRSGSLPDAKRRLRFRPGIASSDPSRLLCSGRTLFGTSHSRCLMSD